MNLNPKIQKHKAYFCSTFTTAIYKLDIIKKNNIKFLESVRIFEDPYFSMTLIPHVNKVEIVNDVKYYYLVNVNSQSKKKLSEDIINDIGFSCLEVLKYLNCLNIDRHHYKIVFSYMYNKLESYAFNVNDGKDVNIAAATNLCVLIEECLYFKDFLIDYFLLKKEKARKEMFLSLRKNIVKK